MTTARIALEMANPQLKLCTTINTLMINPPNPYQKQYGNSLWSAERESHEFSNIISYRSSQQSTKYLTPMSNVKLSPGELKVRDESQILNIIDRTFPLIVN